MAVTESTRQRLEEFPDYHGVIADTIWTGDDASGYRTSMRWTSRGSKAIGPGDGRLSEANSCIANCAIVGTTYVEEWAAGNGLHYLRQLGEDVETALTRVRTSAVLTGRKGAEHTTSLGVQVPAIPDVVDGPGLLVVELLDQLFNRRNLDIADRLYAPGAPYTFGSSRWNAGPDGARHEVSRWLELLPDAAIDIQELYWNGDNRSAKVAVRYRVTGTAPSSSGPDRPVAMTCIHHVHVRGSLVVAEWVEYDELALLAQAGRLAQ